MILPLNAGSEMSKNLFSVRMSKAKRSLRLTTNFVDSENPFHGLRLSKFVFTDFVVSSASDV